jgi:UDP-N-acetylmuramoyl-L-alanyl-D-glutamate--2,6-diaminopimelate ligase
MRLSKVIEGTGAAGPLGGDPEVTLVTGDSRAVRPGAVFFALVGSKADGHAFAAEAARRGAVAVVAEREVACPPALLLVAPSARRAMAIAASNHFGRPGTAMKLAGVTGTNGKTTVAYLVEACARSADVPVAVLGTVTHRWPGGSRPASHTTPESTEVAAILALARDAGARLAVLEVSSHALAQERAAGLTFDVAAFTNLTRDHLDYHGDLETYFQAKRRLFLDHTKPSGVAVVNADDPFGARLARDLEAAHGARVWRFGRCGRELAARDVRFGLSGIEAELSTPAGPVALRSPLVGAHNLENLLCAAGLALSAGLPREAVERGLASCPGAPGRLERVEARGIAAFVDYAHTDDALARALAALRALEPRRLLVVFGCGGDRDRGKRPLMGEAAARAADVAVVTSDNPRSEDPAAIIAEIVPGLERAGMRRLAPSRALAGDAGYLVVADRREAISLALSAARAGDAVLIAGKGHEDYQLIGEQRLPFDDREEARRALGIVESEQAAPPIAGPQRAGRRAVSERGACAAQPLTSSHTRKLPMTTLPSFTRYELASAAGGRWIGTPPAEVRGISTDTRQLTAGACFLALRGDRFDAHDFLAEARAKGAACAVVDESWVSAQGGKGGGLPLLAVRDTLAALGMLARFHRRRFAIPVVGVTGSNGKTTTRQMLGLILRTRGPALVTEGNLNNEVGVPLTLLGLSPEHQRAVIEMGMNHAGEIARLAAITEPQVGIVTMAGPGHVEYFGTVDGVADAKAELYFALPPGGIAVANADDARMLRRAQAAGRALITFAVGRGRKGDAVVLDVLAHGADGLRFTLGLGQKEVEIELPLAGVHNAANAAAAAAAAMALGFSDREIAQGLREVRPVGRRLRIEKLASGVTLVDDCYNANPASMTAALCTLAALAAGGDRPVAVLGDMLELGPMEDEAHRALGEEAAGVVRLLFAFGPRSRRTAEAARAAGLADSFHADDMPALVEQVRARLASGDLLLVKGSRGNRLERLVEALGSASGQVQAH